jgi:hypothetical protein
MTVSFKIYVTVSDRQRVKDMYVLSFIFNVTICDMLCTNFSLKLTVFSEHFNGFSVNHLPAYSAEFFFFT